MKQTVWTGLVVLALIVSAVLPFQGRAEKLSLPQSINVEKLQSMIRLEKVVLVNVAGLIACLDAKIPGSLCLSCSESQSQPAFFSLTKGSKIVFYGGNGPVDPECTLVKRTIAAGFTSVYFLQGGLAAWRMAGQMIVSDKRIPRVFSHAVHPRSFSDWQKKAKSPLIIDIRTEQAYAAGHLDGAENFPLSRLHQQYPEIPLDRTLLIVDQDGTESFLAASYLARKGLLHIQRLKGGMAAYRGQRR